MILLKDDLVRTNDGTYAEVLQNCIDQESVIVQKVGAAEPETVLNSDCLLIYVAQAVQKLGGIDKAVKAWEKAH